jgi:drug/metabolite transporter (DMT)-like permease
MGSSWESVPLKSKITARIGTSRERLRSAAMPLSALLLALAAAFVHALWNLLLARARDPEAATAVALVVAVVVFAPVSVFAWGLEREVWPYLVVTSGLQLLYFSLLITGYRKAEMSVVYPVARGVAPTIVLLAGIVVLGYSTSWAQAAGVVLVGLGVLAIRGVRGDAGGVLFGLGIAAVIASYTLVDKRGLDYATPIAYLEVSMIAPAILYAAWVARMRGGAVALRSELNRSSVVAGIATFTAYALVLAALERASAASVAAVRETSVVIATLLAAVVLKEQVTPVRLTGAIFVACGVALLAAGG